MENEQPLLCGSAELDRLGSQTGALRPDHKTISAGLVEPTVTVSNFNISE